MRPLSCRVPPRPEILPSDPPGSRDGDLSQRHAVADVLGEARCPLCRVPLVPRLDRDRIYFSCACPQWCYPPDREPGSAPAG
jgi:hypothetical protein